MSCRSVIGSCEENSKGLSVPHKQLVENSLLECLERRILDRYFMFIF